MAAYAPATGQHAAPGRIGGRRAASFAAHLSAPVINMGLEEIQKQAKAA